MPELSWWQWTIGCFCAYLVGVAKTGVPGIGILVVPLMAVMLSDAKESAGWLLPLLCAADIFAVLYWRRHTAIWKLFTLAPWVASGMVIGAIALTLNERFLRPIVGGISVCHAHDLSGPPVPEFGIGGDQSRSNVRSDSRIRHDGRECRGTRDELVSPQ